jgi:tetratricopeptide (TPR) repeat protein
MITLKTYVIFLFDKTQEYFYRRYYSEKRTWENEGNKMSQKSSGDQARALLDAINPIFENIGETPFRSVRNSLHAGVVTAITTFQQSSPDKMTPELFAWLGYALTKLSRYGEAEDALRTATELDPNSASLQSNLACALEQLGRHTEAMEACQTAIKLDPDSVIAHGNLGYALSKLGRYDEAVDALRTAIELDPTLPYPHWILAEVRLRRHPDDTDAALSHLKDAFDQAGRDTKEPFWFSLYESTIAASPSPDEAQETLRQWSRPQDMAPV